MKRTINLEQIQGGCSEELKETAAFVTGIGIAWGLLGGPGFVIALAGGAIQLYCSSQASYS